MNTPPNVILILNHNSSAREKDLLVFFLYEFNLANHMNSKKIQIILRKETSKFIYQTNIIKGCDTHLI